MTPIQLGFMSVMMSKESAFTSQQVQDRHRRLVDFIGKKIIRRHTMAGAAIGGVVTGGAGALQAHLDNKKIKKGPKKSLLRHGLGYGAVGAALGGAIGHADGHSVVDSMHSSPLRNMSHHMSFRSRNDTRSYLKQHGLWSDSKSRASWKKGPNSNSARWDQHRKNMRSHETDQHRQRVNEERAKWQEAARKAREEHSKKREEYRKAHEEHSKNWDEYKKREDESRKRNEESRKKWDEYQSRSSGGGYSSGSRRGGRTADKAPTGEFWDKIPEAKRNKIRGIASHAKRTPGPEGDTARNILRNHAQTHGFNYDDAIKHAGFRLAMQMAAGG